MRLKITFLTFCAAVLFIASCTTDNHTITFNIKGLGNDTVKVEYFPVAQYGNDKPQIIDTVFSINGKFHYDLSVNEDIVMILQPAKLPIERAGGNSYLTDARFIFLIVRPNERLKVTGRITDSNYLDYQVKGSVLMSDYIKVRESCAAQNTLIDTLITREYFYMFSKKAADISMKQRDSMIYAIRKERAKLNAEINEKKLSYIKNHLDRDLAGYFLLTQPIDTFTVYYKQLPESVKTGLFAKILYKKHLDYQKYSLREQAKKTVVKGTIAPDFTLKNLADEDFSLSSKKGKYLVLDFWGSWCHWCIVGFPKMKEYYEKYKSKVEFIGIACRDKDDKWRKAIKDNELNWLHVIDDESDDITRNVSVKYAIGGYPTKIILDKDLKIVEIIVGESDEFYKKLDELLK